MFCYSNVRVSKFIYRDTGNPIRNNWLERWIFATENDILSAIFLEDNLMTVRSDVHERENLNDFATDPFFNAIYIVTGSFLKYFQRSK